MKTYSFTEAVKFLNTSDTTLSDLLVNGVIRAAKIGQTWCIREEDLDAYLKSEVDRQTAERLEFIARGEKPRVKTARGQRTPKPDLDKEFGVAA